MVFVGCLILVFWLGILPICAGGFFCGKRNEYNNSIAFRFMAGAMLLWALFQLVCVPCVILQKDFTLVVSVYSVLGLVTGVAGLFRGRKNPLVLPKVKGCEKKERIAWLVFFCLLAIQLICAVVLNYADGDDAFYVAVSEIVDDSNTMYQKSPYTIGATELDIRHGLAPFPVWIAFLARISGMHTAITAHVIVGTYLIGVSYIVFYLLGKQLFSEKKELVPVFLDMVALLVLYGDYSSRTPENFMIARSRQGKAAIGSIVIPMLIFLLLVLLKRIQEEKKTELSLWMAFVVTVVTACLCTTLGTFLSCAMLGCVGLCVLLVYKKVIPVVKLALCCTPAVFFALLYFVLG